MWRSLNQLLDKQNRPELQQISVLKRILKDLWTRERAMPPPDQVFTSKSQGWGQHRMSRAPLTYLGLSISSIIAWESRIRRLQVKPTYKKVDQHKMPLKFRVHFSKSQFLPLPDPPTRLVRNA